jgi:signal transduction histidine kinase/ActR/RegA family two-component response regulator
MTNAASKRISDHPALAPSQRGAFAAPSATKPSASAGLGYATKISLAVLSAAAAFWSVSALMPGSGARRASILAVTFGLFSLYAAVQTFRALSGRRKSFKGLARENEKLSDRVWELSETGETPRGIFDLLGDLAVHQDHSGKIIYANENFRKAASGIAPDPLGKTLADFAVKPRKQNDSQAFAVAESELGGRWYSWAEYVARDGASGRTYRQAVARDITSHKISEKALIGAREKAEAASSAKSHFLATVSHEIRTPLNGITGMARLLADTPLTNEQRTYVEAVVSSGNSLLGLIEDILDFSKIEAGRIDIEPEPIHLREFAENLVELMASRAFAKGIGIGLHIAPGVPGTIVADPLRLRQALLNLLGNAVKFTLKGGAVLEISADANSALLFTVRDSGPGIPLREQERIFEEFEQADASSTRRHGGAGLGLAITRRIAEAMGGTVTLFSHKGSGAAFTLRMPVAAFDPDGPKSRRLDGIVAFVLMDCRLEAEALAASIAGEGGMAVVVRSALDLSSPSGSTLIVDTASAERIMAGFEDFADGFDEKIILIEPKDRGSLPRLRARGFGSFLARPIRLETLVRVLHGKPGIDEDDLKPQLSGSFSEMSAGRQLRVLLAEDNDISALLVTSALERAGHLVTRVSDGRSAVARAADRQQRFDMILMDLHMPELDGMDAIAAIRAGEEERSSPAIPILVLTADGQAETEAAARGVGATGFITKPVDPFRLLDIVEETLQLPAH